MICFYLTCLSLEWHATAQAQAVEHNGGSGPVKPVLGGQPWSPAAKQRLDHDIDALVAGAPTLRGAHAGLLAVDARTGNILYSRNSDDAFVPASTMKLLTGSVALATLGPGYRFHTDASIDAASGGLVIRAGGDPLLRVDDLEAMASTLRASGIRTLPGGVRIDARAFDATPYPPGWSWDDFGYDYAPMLSAAVIEENVVHLTVAPGLTIGAPASVRSTVLEPDATGAFSPGCVHAAAVEVIVHATTTAAGTPAALDVGRTPDGCIEVLGTLPIDASPHNLDAAVPNPIVFMEQIAVDALRSSGIHVPSPHYSSSVCCGAGALAEGGTRVATRAETVAPARTDLSATGDPRTGTLAGTGSSAVEQARLVWTHSGEPLAALLAGMWWPSDNLVAEQLLKAVALQRAGAPATIDAGTDTERAWLTGIGIDPATVTIADGSGLSTYDRLTPRALVAILQADWNGPNRDIVLDDLPVAGVRGTLQHSLAGSSAERRTFAKTGSVMHARGLAGYLATRHHGAVTFAWSVDDWLGTNDDLDALRARVLSRIIDD